MLDSDEDHRFRFLPVFLNAEYVFDLCLAAVRVVVRFFCYSGMNKGNILEGVSE